MPNAGSYADERILLDSDLGNLVIHPEILQLWVRRDEADDCSRSDRLTTAEREDITELHREIRVQKRPNEILKAASVFFAANSTSLVRWSAFVDRYHDRFRVEPRRSSEAT